MGSRFEYDDIEYDEDEWESDERVDNDTYYGNYHEVCDDDDD